MRSRSGILLFLFFPFLAKAQEPVLVLKHITVVDVKKGGLIKNVSVSIRGNRIEHMGNNIEIPYSATIIEARNKYLIPGLWDMHVHLSYYGKDALAMLAANGITGVRDMGGNLTQIDEWRDEIAAGKLAGPRIKRAGPFIDGPKKMSPLRASFTRIPASENAARQLVDSLKTAGVDFIKVHSRLSRAIFFAVSDEARRQHIPVVVHLPKAVSPEDAVRAGVRSIEHTESLLGSVIYEEQDTVRTRQTISALKKLYGTYGKKLAASIAAHKIFYDPTLISLYRVHGTGYEKMLAPRLLPLITQLHQAKVKLLTGSDFAGKDAGIRPGYDLHDELVLFTQAGLTPLEALQAATVNAAECLYMTDSLGTVEEGKIADLVLLNADPLKNIHNSRDIFAAVLNGHYWPAEALKRRLLKADQ
ncbi:hypothetical protein A8C56_05355 [Niabella ginsenosidivorans]|uniref:Amidohydrolase-related domain-containing protein n=1 Tax=Niabella ginsenosidivorans TaxID=1176587 RepID=A0A1A9I1C1_9BACT|nr:amidohydrolase family protein [Niabella ginsenosidivorans]ANH80492.1 hypothetical protein A8C56_05355 [Niabella ginsenosidivorans]